MENRYACTRKLYMAPGMLVTAFFCLQPKLCSEEFNIVNSLLVHHFWRKQYQGYILLLQAVVRMHLPFVSCATPLFHNSVEFAYEAIFLQAKQCTPKEFFLTKTSLNFPLPWQFLKSTYSTTRETMQTTPFNTIV